jgi:DNA recombination protein RmuC
MAQGIDILAVLPAALQRADAPALAAASLAGLVAGSLLCQWRIQRQKLRVGVLEERERQLELQVRRAQQANDQLSAEQRRLQQAVAAAHARLQERELHQVGQREFFTRSREELTREFELLANRIFEDRGQQWSSVSRQGLEDTLKPLKTQIDSFQQRVNQVHSESLRGQSSLAAELRQVRELGLEMNTSATRLGDALRGNNKVAGTWGEAQLTRTLELAGLRPGEHFRTQAALRDCDGRQRYPDCLILLPDDKQLVIDSKLSLADYERAVAAADEDERGAALDAHVQAVKRHVEELAAKDYAALPGLESPDFVLMFMPVESAWIETMRHHRDLFDLAWNQGVALVSHTTLMPVLRTVANLWMVEESHREAREIGERAGELYNQVGLVAERLLRLGNSLRAAGNHYNDAVRALTGQQGLQGKVERFRQLSARANRDIPSLEPIHSDLEQERLRLVTADAERARGGTGSAPED